MDPAFVGDIVAPAILVMLALAGTTAAIWMARARRRDPEVRPPWTTIVLAALVVGACAFLVSLVWSGLIPRPMTLGERLAMTLPHGVIAGLATASGGAITAAVVTRLGGRGVLVALVTALGAVAIAWLGISVAMRSASDAAYARQAQEEARKEAALVERSAAVQLVVLPSNVVHGKAVNGEPTVRSATLQVVITPSVTIDRGDYPASLSVSPVATFAQRADVIDLPRRLEAGRSFRLEVPVAFDVGRSSVPTPIWLSEDATEFRGVDWVAYVFMTDAEGLDYRVEAAFAIQRP